MLDLEASGSEQVFEMLNGVFVTVFRMNPFTPIKVECHIKRIYPDRLPVSAFEMQFNARFRLIPE